MRELRLYFWRELAQNLRMETSPESRFQSAQLTIIIVLLLILVGIAITQVYTGYQPPAQVTYEYMLGSEPDATLKETINKLGAQGWELVFARRVVDSLGADAKGQYEMIFRRPLALNPRP